MNQYYQDLITEKSWQLLQSLRKKYHFVLIGGWAVYLYTRNLKSKDIDIIADYELLERLKKEFELSKNERLKKYEIKKEGIDIDIYLPYFSDLGLPVEKIIASIDQVDTFTVVKKEMLLITKIKAYLERRTSIKGQKDKIDIISLIFLNDFDFALFRNIIKENRLKGYLEILHDILSETKEVPELKLNKHFFAKRKKNILEKI